MAKKNQQPKTTGLNEPKGSQIQKAPPSELAGIEFADETPADPRANDHQTTSVPEFTPERNRANQTEARRVLDHLRVEPVELVAEKPVLPDLDPEVEKSIAPKLYVLKQPATIARGGSTYNLPAGKRITNRDYDIESLRAQGVQLEEVRTA